MRLLCFNAFNSSSRMCLLNGEAVNAIIHRSITQLSVYGRTSVWSRSESETCRLRLFSFHVDSIKSRSGSVTWNFRVGNEYIVMQMRSARNTCILCSFMKYHFVAVLLNESYETPIRISWNTTYVAIFGRVYRNISVNGNIASRPYNISTFHGTCH